jgi:hypothetical protein
MQICLQETSMWQDGKFSGNTDQLAEQNSLMILIG